MPNELTTTEIEQHTPVWFALSKLWVDNQLHDNDLEKYEVSADTTYENADRVMTLYPTDIIVQACDGII